MQYGIIYGLLGLPARHAVCAGLMWALLFAAAGHAADNIVLPAIFGDNMVLQRDVPIPVWGIAAPGASVTVACNGQAVTVQADADGRWRADLPSMPAGGPHELVVTGVNTVRVTNVMVGEVWLCGGQSNMGIRLAEIKNGGSEASATNYPDLRLFVMQKLPSEKPRHFKERQGKVIWGYWQPDKLQIDYAAIPHFFGQAVSSNLNVPVGIINMAVGGTPIETWCSAETLASDDAYAHILARWEKILADYPAAQSVFEEKFKAWQAAAERAKAENRSPPPRPAPPLGPLHKDRPSNLYNGVIHPLMPLAIRGVIWYQGEANTRDAKTYGKLFPAMIRDWRRAWGQGDFPFIFVQLPEYQPLQRTPNDPAPWAELREAQALALAEPRTGMAVALGLGDAQNIHPLQKPAVAHRLWLAAAAVAYELPVVAGGPRFKSMAVKNGELRLRFESAGSGLAARDGKLEGFALAGADGKYVWAEARLDGDTVALRHPAVPAPRSVRYAWANNPVWSLTNREGLPAAPFRAELP